MAIQHLLLPGSGQTLLCMICCMGLVQTFQVQDCGSLC